MAEVYAERMTEEELHSAVEFYKTQAGQRLASVSQEASLAFQARQQERAASIQRRIEENFRKRLEGTYLKFQQEDAERCAPEPQKKRKI